MPADLSLEIAKSIKMACTQLNAIKLSIDDDRSQLPEKEQFGPNQLSWPPTAAQMGVKQGEKHHTKVDSTLMAEHIGVPKHKRPNEDSYGAGEDAGKRTKPDAILAAANAQAHTKAAECPPPALLPTCLSPSPASYTQPQPSSSPASYAQPQPSLAPASSVQPQPSLTSAPYAQSHPIHPPMMHFPIPPEFSASTLLSLFHVFTLHIPPFYLDHFVCSFVLFDLENKTHIVISWKITCHLT